MLRLLERRGTDAARLLWWLARYRRSGSTGRRRLSMDRRAQGGVSENERNTREACRSGGKSHSDSWRVGMRGAMRERRFQKTKFADASRPIGSSTRFA